MDITKRQTAKKGNKLDEMTREDNLSVDARNVLQNLAIEFLEACFNRMCFYFILFLIHNPNPFPSFPCCTFEGYQIGEGKDH